MTPVENLLIEEIYAPARAGDYGKVYIYGLRLCYHPVKEASVASIARALGLEEKTVMDAFAYWERVGVLRRTGDNPPTYSYFDLKEAMMTGKAEDDVTKADRSFNTALQDLFGTRLLQAAAVVSVVYGWMEGFAIQAGGSMLMLASALHPDQRQGHERDALPRWKRRRCAGPRRARPICRRQRTICARFPPPVEEGRRKWCAKWGLRRAPTVDGEALYTKWWQEWGFSLDAILYSCRETTKDLSAEFSPIWIRCWKTAYKKQLSTAREMECAERSRTDAMRPVREVLETLGTRGTAPTEDLAMLYAGWLRMGFTHEAILLAARHALRQGKNNDGGCDAVSCRSWAKAVASYTAEAMNAYLSRRRQNIQRCYALL